MIITKINPWYIIKIKGITYSTASLKDKDIQEHLSKDIQNVIKKLLYIIK